MNTKRGNILFLIIIFIISFSLVIWVAKNSERISDNYTVSGGMVSQLLTHVNVVGEDIDEDVYFGSKSIYKYEIKPYEEIKLTFILPDLRIYSYPSILFFSNVKHIKVYLDDVLLYAQETNSHFNFDTHPIVIGLSKSDTKKNVTIRLINSSNKNSIITLHSLFLGDRHTLNLKYVVHDFYSTLFFASFLGLSVLILIFGLYFNNSYRRHIIFSLGLFLIFNSLFQIFYSDTIYFFFTYPLIFSILARLLFSFLPFVTLFYVKDNIVPSKEHKAINYFERVSFLFPFYFIIILIFDIFPNTYLVSELADSISLIFYGSYIICLLIYSAYITIRYTKTKYFELLFLSLFDVTMVIKVSTELIFQTLFDKVSIFLVLNLCLMIFITIRDSAKSTQDVLKDDYYKENFADPLTKLLNRFAFEYRIKDIESRGKDNYYIISIDIDYMKTYNDTLGHKAGDELLISFSKAVNNVISSHEALAFRIGGDEFIILLKQTKNIDIVSFINLLLENFKELNQFQLSSFSYGYYLYEAQKGMKIKDAIKKSDDNLLIYKANTHRQDKLREGFSNTEPKH